jgi:PAS domain S-box-containing protein
MTDQRKTKAQLIQELVDLRRELATLKTSEEALKAQRRQLFRALDAIPALAYLQAPDYSIPFANSSFRALYGDIEGRPCYEVLHGRAKPCDECPTFEIFDTGEPKVWEWTDPSQGRVYLACEHPFADDDGSPLVLDLAIDITPLKETEEALRAAEEQKAAILDSMSELVAYQDTEMTVIWANRAAAKSVSLSMDELVGSHCYELWQKRNEPCEGCPVIAARQTGQPQEAEIASPDGRMWRIRGYPVKDRDGGVVGVVEVTLDITQQKGIEQALRQSERRYRGFFEDSPIALWEEDFTDVKAYFEELHRAGVKDLGAHFESHPEIVRECADLVKLVRVNRTALELYGGQTVEDFREGLPSIFDEESYDVFKAELAAIAEGKTRFDAETTARTLDGEKRHLMLRWSVVRGFEDTLSRVLVSDIDITERKRAEEALQGLMEFNESVVQNMGEGVIVLDEQGNITFTNPSADSLLEYKAEELIGQHWTRIVPPDCQAAVDGALHETARFELEVLRKDEERVPVLVSSSPRLDQGLPTGSLWVFTDITDRKRSEKALKEYSGRLEEMVEEQTQELREAQKELMLKERLAILGQLAGGVSHELRNPLATITNAVYFLQMTLAEADEKTQDYLHLIASQAQIAGKIVSDLLDFSRETPADRQRMPIPELVAQLWERRPPPDNVEATTLVPDNLPPAFVDPQQIGQVLENLVINAYQAMPDGGSLTVRADAKGGRLHLSIIDTGVGIPEEHMEKLFEPLFSTKPRGIGLGLAVSKTLVQANGGSIEVESEEGKGSTFTVILPCAEAQD